MNGLHGSLSSDRYKYVENMVVAIREIRNLSIYRILAILGLTYVRWQSLGHLKNVLDVQAEGSICGL